MPELGALQTECETGILSGQLETTAQSLYNKEYQKAAEVAELADAADSKSVAL
jgi:hypothetical protein